MSQRLEQYMLGAAPGKVLAPVWDLNPPGTTFTVTLPYCMKETRQLGSAMQSQLVIKMTIS